MENNHHTPPETIPVDGQRFTFACNHTIPCFTRCCHNADLLLYPYDIIRLKQHLKMSSDEFLVSHTITAFRYSKNFPNVMLKMSDAQGRPCPFLTGDGCSVYPNRPFSCRAYPLELGMSGDGDGDGSFSLSSFLVCHDHCKGHGQGRSWTPKEWMKDQDMDAFTPHNAAWARAASLLFARNALAGQGADNPAMNMAYMASYDMDTFRRFVFKSSFLNRFDVPFDRIEKVRSDDIALMHLGFDWIRRFLGGQGPLKEKQG